MNTLSHSQHPKATEAAFFKKAFSIEKLENLLKFSMPDPKCDPPARFEQQIHGKTNGVVMH